MGGMRLDETLHLPLRPDAVAAMYADPAYAAVRAETLHAADSSSDITGDPAGAFTATTRLSLPTAGVPDIARRFVGETVTVRETQSWSAPQDGGRRTGTMDIQVEGAPASLSAQLEMMPEGEGGTLVRIAGDLVAKVPLVGGRLEKAALPYVSKILRAEERSAATYAARTAD